MEREKSKNDPAGLHDLNGEVIGEKEKGETTFDLALWTLGDAGVREFEKRGWAQGY